MQKKDELGLRGEEMAVALLLDKGYEVLNRNLSIGKGELDVICLDSDELVFVEVKTRQSSYFGDPYQAVTKKKQRQIIKIADLYVKQNGFNNDSRFDVISVIINSKERSIEHIENAFVPGL